MRRQRTEDKVGACGATGGIIGQLRREGKGEGRGLNQNKCVPMSGMEAYDQATIRFIGQRKANEVWRHMSRQQVDS